MNWDAIGAIGDFASAIAVLVTLFYLSIQIRSNTAQARRAAHDETMRQASANRMALAQSAELAALVLKGADHFETLTPIERLQFESFVNDRFWAWFQIWDRAQSGQMEADGWSRLRTSPPLMMLTPGALRCWDASKGQYPARFSAEIESIRKEHRRDA